MAKMTDKQRIEFAKQIESMYEAGQTSWKRVLTLSFLKGIFTGLGVFIGGTIIVALLLWILGGLGQVPLLHHVSKSVENSLEKH